jgi:phage terminase large subunit
MNAPLGKIYLPQKGWRPREHQKKLWRYLMRGGKRAVAVWHRRAGKDEICLHATSVAMIKRPANYIHLLPEFAMARRAIWESVNPHTAKRRIDECFPLAMRANTNEGSMFIRYHNGSTWSVGGSDAIVSGGSGLGSSVAGIVFSEAALARPEAWGFYRPILEENNGWATWISTPRGRNYFLQLYQHAKRTDGWFAEQLPATETAALSAEALAEALTELVNLYGEDHGKALFDQEMMCSWNASIQIGAFYAHEMMQVRNEGRISDDVVALPDQPVHRAWDLGVGDDTSIWWFQPRGSQLLILDHYAASGVGVEHYADVIKHKANEHGWRHGTDFVPHDAKVKEFGSGRTRVETMAGMGLKPMLVPWATLDDGINAVRRTLPLCVFHSRTEEGGISALEQYRREWDDDKKAFRASAVHDWTSHPCFTGDTRVLTRHGTYRMMDLPKTGEVLTPCGWKRYHSPRVTRRNAPLVEVQFTDGLTVRCTPDHLFKTAGGWKSAKCLAKGSLIQSSLTLSRSILMAASIACGLARRTTLAVARQCIALFGGWHSETSLVGVTSITKTVTRPIIDLKTWSAYQPKSTWLSHLKIVERAAAQRVGSQIRRETLLLSGIDLRKGDCGTGATLSERRGGQNGGVRKNRVLNAAKSSTLSFVRAVTRRFIAILTARPLRIARVTVLNQCEDVYCITVPGEEAFSLANGAVVHNCDAFRYLSMGYKLAARRAVPEPQLTGWRIPPPQEPRRGGIVL